MSDAARAHPARFPAYGRELFELRRQGLVPSRGFMFAHVVVCLDSWRWAKAQTRLVVPQDADLGALDFSMIAGLDVILVYRPSVSTVARRDALIVRLLRYLPTELVVFDMDEPHEWFTVKSTARGLERQEYAT